jgi:homoserine dehydrogenase
MDAPVRPCASLGEIEREGIRDLTPQALRNARRDGWPFKLVCRAQREVNWRERKRRGQRQARKSPGHFSHGQRITGTSSYIHFETDIFPGLAITEENPGLYATAYGMLADFVRAVGVEYRCEKSCAILTFARLRDS